MFHSVHVAKSRSSDVCQWTLRCVAFPLPRQHSYASSPGRNDGNARNARAQQCSCTHSDPSQRLDVYAASVALDAFSISALFALQCRTHCIETNASDAMGVGFPTPTLRSAMPYIYTIYWIPPGMKSPENRQITKQTRLLENTVSFTCFGVTTRAEVVFYPAEVVRVWRALSSKNSE